MTFSQNPVMRFMLILEEAPDASLHSTKICCSPFFKYSNSEQFGVLKADRPPSSLRVNTVACSPQGREVPSGESKFPTPTAQMTSVCANAVFTPSKMTSGMTSIRM